MPYIDGDKVKSIENMNSRFMKVIQSQTVAGNAKSHQIKVAQNSLGFIGAFLDLS